MNILSVKNLDVFFNTDDGIITAVEDVSFEIKEGEILGLVGESGSGKSVTAKSLMQLNPLNTIYGERSNVRLKNGNMELEVLSLKKGREMENYYTTQNPSMRDGPHVGKERSQDPPGSQTLVSIERVLCNDKVLSTCNFGFVSHSKNYGIQIQSSFHQNKTCIGWKLLLRSRLNLLI